MSHTHTDQTTTIPVEENSQPTQVGKSLYLKKLAGKWLSNDITRLLGFTITIKAILLLIGSLSYSLYNNRQSLTLGFDVKYLRASIYALERSDVYYYFQIVTNGYEHRPFSLDRQVNWNFYPLWPIVLKIGYLFNSNLLLVGILLSNLLFLVALVYLYKLITIDFSREVAYLAVVLTVIFPSAYLFSRPGPEAIFLLLTVASLYYAKKGRLFVAVLLGGLATITRVQGILIVFPLAYLFYQQLGLAKPKLAKYLYLLLIPLSLFGFMLYLYSLTGNLFTNFEIQKAWDSSFAFPFTSFVQYLSDPQLLSYYSFDVAILSFIGIIFLVVLALVMWFRRDFPREYFIYAVLSILVIVSRNNVQATLRFASVIFPVHLMLALLLYKHKTAYNLVFFTFIALQTFYSIGLFNYYNWGAN